MDVREPESWDELFAVAAEYRRICPQFQEHLRQFEYLSDALRALPAACDVLGEADAEDAYEWFWREGDDDNTGPDFDQTMSEAQIEWCVQRAREFWFEAISS